MVASCAALVTTPAPPALRTIAVLPVDNRTGSPLYADGPSLLGLIDQRSGGRITAGDLLGDALRSALAECGFTVLDLTRAAGPGDAVPDVAAAARRVATLGSDAAGLYVRLTVWDGSAASHLLYVDVALDAALVRPDGTVIWEAHLPATPIDGGGASSVSLGYPVVARTVAQRITADLRPATTPREGPGSPPATRANGEIFLTGRPVP